MNHPFVLGRVHLRQDLLDFVGSRQGQTGIIWGPLEPTVVLCTSGGRHGARAGYHDLHNKDGTWTYFGQGESGDQSATSFANRLLVDGTRSVLLFETQEPTAAEVRASGSWQKRYRFVGEFCSANWAVVVPASGARKGDKLLQFTLVPVGAGPARSKPHDAGSRETLSRARSLVELRRRIAQLGPVQRRKTFAAAEFWQRSELVREWALRRAMGHCEYCGATAPFLDRSGEPFLEVHHILRLADEGPDLVNNVAGLCPNCHRQAHQGQDSAGMRARLAELVNAREQAIAGEMAWDSPSQAEE